MEDEVHERAPRRCTSTPPSARFGRKNCHGFELEADTSEEEDEGASAGTQSTTLKVVTKARWSDLLDGDGKGDCWSSSTTSGSPRGLSSTSMSDFTSEEASATPMAAIAGYQLNPNAPEWSPMWEVGAGLTCYSLGLPPPGHFFPGQALLMPTGEVWQEPPEGGAAEKTPPLAAAAAEGCSGATTPVAPAAALCTPASGVGPSAAFPLQPFAVLVEAAASALRKGPGIIGVDIFEVPGPHSQGWTLVAWMRPEDAETKDEALDCAKEALLHTAEQTDNIYVMGYTGQPFVPTELGFAAMLGSMQDERCACWDMYTKGFCPREGVCMRQHPESLIAISVQVKLACMP